LKQNVRGDLTVFVCQASKFPRVSDNRIFISACGH
jgi:hypothetical protein